MIRIFGSMLARVLSSTGSRVSPYKTRRKAAAVHPASDGPVSRGFDVHGVLSGVQP